MTAPETVATYNMRHLGKAWSIVAITRDGAVTCADCARDIPAEDDHGVIFGSDDYCGMSCDACLRPLCADHPNGIDAD